MTDSSALQILFRPSDPNKLPPQAAPDSGSTYGGSRFEAMVQRWRETFDVTDPAYTADLEDWTENASALFAALDSGYPVYSQGARSWTGMDGIQPLANGATVLDEEVPVMLAGSQPKRDAILGYPNSIVTGAVPFANVVWPDLTSMRSAERYASNPGFHKVAGRRTALASLPAEDLPPRETDLPNLMASWAADGAVDGIMKIVAHDPKYSEPLPFHLPAGATLETARDVALHTLEYAYVHLEGVAGAVLLQEAADMRHEYRMFVVNGEPVAGAGCIEDMTPVLTSAHHLIGAFDQRTETKRNDGSRIADPSIVETYRRFAPKAITALQECDPELRDFTLDLCLYEDGSPGVVEVNSLPGSGFYATPVQDHLFPAMEEAALTRLKTPAPDPA